MEVQFTPELEKKLNDLAAQTGRGPGELVQDVVAGYVDDLAGVREMLDSRYDDLKSGRLTEKLSLITSDVKMNFLECVRPDECRWGI